MRLAAARSTRRTVTAAYFRSIRVSAHHGPEEMFCVLIAILCFDVVTIENSRAGQGEIAFILAFGIGNQMFAAAVGRR